MKKMLPFIFAILLLLTACAPSAYPNTERGKKYGYFTYPDTDFGMTEEEFLEALGETSEKLIRDDDPSLVYRLEGTTFLDKKADVWFEFSEMDGVEPFLFTVTIYFQEEIEPFAMMDQIRAFANGQEVALEPEELRLSLTDKGGNPIDVDQERFQNETDNTAAHAYLTLQSKTKPSVLPEDIYEKAQENFDAYGPENGTLDTVKETGLGSLSFSWYAQREENGELVTKRSSLSIAGTIGVFEHYAALTE